MDKNNRNLILTLAWRSLWKNKRRTIITLLTIVVGCLMIVFMNAFAKGGHDAIINDAVAANTGHIQIHEKGFWDNQGIETAFKPSAKLLQKIKGDKRIKGYSQRIHAGGLISHKDNTFGVSIQAIDPQFEKTVTVIHKKMRKDGRYLNMEDTKSTIIGETLAKNLDAKIGSTLTMISQGFDGTIAADEFKVVGIFKSGNPEYDRGKIFIPLNYAKTLFSMSGYINSITLRVGDTEDIYPIRNELKTFLKGKERDVMAWDDLMPDLVQWIVMDDAGAIIFIALLYLIVAFGVLNTVQMSIFERIREFGVMLAIGTRPKQVLAIVITETTFIALIGTFFGIILGSALSYYYQVNPIEMGQYAEEFAVWGVSTTTMGADLSMRNVVWTTILTISFSVLSSILPARKAAALNPIRAIRQL